nr:hypothetical protein [Azospirillum sp. INR13]
MPAPISTALSASRFRPISSVRPITCRATALAIIPGRSDSSVRTAL